MTDARKPASNAPVHAAAPASPQRRTWLGNAAKAATGLGMLSLADPLVRRAAWAAGSDAPEKKEVKVGFIPLTDCASVVMASVLGLDKKHGVTIIPTKEASWAGVREKLANGDLDFAHALYGMIYGMHLGIAGNRQDMAVLMGLNQNGQGITLSKQLHEAGVVDGDSLHKKMASEPRQYTFAHTFPTGTHAMWLYYWLASHGIDPAATRTVTVPPPQMVANMRIGNVDGYCVGEPWNARAIIDKVGFSAAASQDIWPGHPEKVLGTRQEFVQRHPNTARAVTAAILEAGRWIDSSPENVRKTAQTIAAKSYVNTDAATIVDRMLGRYANGLGKSWNDSHSMRFHDGGAANYPYLSDGMWFLTQHKRWGLLKTHPDYAAIAGRINRIDVYEQAAAATGTPLPSSPSRSSRLLDGVLWDGSDPAAYADSFAIKAA
ncbi:CmpA/NrtA family ABC transporter substrate-binding protein [Pollutimonas sp. M17]|uniref:CmpA/NrtA family ABC transporter substrate-binding protein n=1 Tax=Pollutimonas sp. M17 TaxID=2962065 RepID=UPI0021F4BD2F|nr:CmpA/NrtA family ABC transporter substrate-binding protein [Pollutimonas sp. M17]UYO93776.1 ABC transporter substrate-binding protein [Pollutimonas sp. M17]